LSSITCITDNHSLVYFDALFLFKNAATGMTVDGVRRKRITWKAPCMGQNTLLAPEEACIKEV
jgi:hypothetical protein